MGESCEFVLVAPESQVELDPEDGIMAKVDKILIARDNNSKIKCWHTLWNALFPGDEPRAIPSHVKLISFGHHKLPVLPSLPQVTTLIKSL